MVFVETAGKRETDEKFGRLWFTSLTRFHRVKDPLTWDFDEKHVIELQPRNGNATLKLRRQKQRLKGWLAR